MHSVTMDNNFTKNELNKNNIENSKEAGTNVEEVGGVNVRNLMHMQS